MTDLQPQLSYGLNTRDEITYVSDAWDRFALENDAPEMVSENILNRSIWDFVSGDTVQHIYRQIILRVRAGQTYEFDFRCDSPNLRRFLTLRTTLGDDDDVLFETRTLRTEQREPQKLMGRTESPVGTDRGLVIACSWCNKIRADLSWYEVEEAVRILGIFDDQPAPRLSHGMCDGCLEVVTRELNDRQK